MKKTCTLEQAKKLKELGVEIDTEYIYVWGILSQSFSLVRRETRPFNCEVSECYSAPDVAELATLLESFEIWIAASNYVCRVSPRPQDSDYEDFPGDEIAHAMCGALIWRLENKSIKPEQVKL